MCSLTIKEPMRAYSNKTLSQEAFLRTLSTSMHEMAQPLSTIQASLELALLTPTTAEQYRSLAEDALVNVQRAVDSMQFAARLARFQQPASDVQDILLSGAIDEVVSDLQCTLDSAQIQLLMARLDLEPLIRISAARLRQMLFYVLQAAQICSQPGDLVEIEIKGGLPSYLTLRIEVCFGEKQAESDRIRQIDEADKGLALACAVANSARASFTVRKSPLLIVVDFPIRSERKACAAGKVKVSACLRSGTATASH
jgi:hypothetical protein